MALLEAPRGSREAATLVNQAAAGTRVNPVAAGNRAHPPEETAAWEIPVMVTLVISLERTRGAAIAVAKATTTAITEMRATSRGKILDVAIPATMMTKRLAEGVGAARLRETTENLLLPT